MATDKDINVTEGLSPFFEAAQVDGRDARAPSDDLMARILADAAAEQPAPAAAVVAPVRRRPDILGSILAALGGWPAAAGLAAIAGVGVLVGYSPPDALMGALDGTALLGTTDDSVGWMLADYDAFLDDG